MYSNTPSRVWLTQTKDFAKFGELTKALPKNTRFKFGRKKAFCLKYAKLKYICCCIRIGTIYSLSYLVGSDLRTGHGQSYPKSNIATIKWPYKMYLGPTKYFKQKKTRYHILVDAICSSRIFLHPWVFRSPVAGGIATYWSVIVLAVYIQVCWLSLNVWGFRNFLSVGNFSQLYLICIIFLLNRLIRPKFNFKFYFILKYLGLTINT